MQRRAIKTAEEKAYLQLACMLGEISGGLRCGGRVDCMVQSISAVH